MSLSGSPGILGIGDLLNNDSTHKNTEIFSRNGTFYDARACQTADNRTLITLVNAPAQSDANLDKIARNIVENLPGAMLSLVRKPDGRLQCGYASPLSPGLFGRGMDELTSPRADFRDLIADEHRSAFDDEFRCGTNTTASINLEIRINNTTRGLVLLRCFGAAPPAEDGTVICYIRMRDVEDRQRDSDDRRRLQDLLDLVIDNIPFMINVKDAHDHTFIMFNRAFEEITGLSRGYILGQKELHLYAELDWKSHNVHYYQLFESRNPVELPEMIVETPNKGRRILKSGKLALIDQAGGVNYVLSITEDVTERRNSETALRHSEQRMLDAAESLTNGGALFNSANQLVMCNTRYWTMWPGREDIAEPGVPLETLVRKFFELAVSHGRNIDIDAKTTKAIEQHRLYRLSRDIPIFDGRWFQVSNHPIADGGFAIPARTLPTLKSAKKACGRRQPVKIKFLANMSHKLRTPLNGVIGFLEIIKEAMLGDHSIEPYRGYAQNIHDSAFHLLSLINDILDMSKIEACKRDLFEEPTELADAIEASLRL